MLIHEGRSPHKQVDLWRNPCHVSAKVSRHCTEFPRTCGTLSDFGFGEIVQRMTSELISYHLQVWPSAQYSRHRPACCSGSQEAPQCAAVEGVGGAQHKRDSQGGHALSLLMMLMMIGHCNVAVRTFQVWSVHCTLSRNLFCNRDHHETLPTSDMYQALLVTCVLFSEVQTSAFCVIRYASYDW